MCFSETLKCTSIRKHLYVLYKAQPRLCVYWVTLMFACSSEKTLRKSDDLKMFAALQNNQLRSWFFRGTRYCSLIYILIIMWANIFSHDVRENLKAAVLS